MSTFVRTEESGSQFLVYSMTSTGGKTRHQRWSRNSKGRYRWTNGNYVDKLHPVKCIDHAIDVGFNVMDSYIFL